MSNKQPRRLDVLMTAAALTTTASIGLANPPKSRAEGTNNNLSPLAQIDAVLRDATEAREVPGVVAMAATDKGILYEGVFGTRDLAKGPAMTRDTVFRIASMTKAVTSVAAMQLVEQGKLKLNVLAVRVILASAVQFASLIAGLKCRTRNSRREETMRNQLVTTTSLIVAVALIQQAQASPPCDDISMAINTCIGGEVGDYTGSTSVLAFDGGRCRT
jgi:hypothetical protein